MMVKPIIINKIKLKSGDEIIVERNTFFDKRCIDVYEYVIKNHIPVEQRNGNWSQEFYRLDEMMTYVTTQFSDQDFINQILSQTNSNNGE